MIDIVALAHCGGFAPNLLSFFRSFLITQKQVMKFCF